MSFQTLLHSLIDAAGVDRAEDNNRREKLQLPEQTNEATGGVGMSPKSTKVAILGLGVIGAAVARLISDRSDEIARRYGFSIEVGRVLERGPERASRANLPETVVTTSIDEIINDDSIFAVVETLGGEEPAASHIAALLRAGKHVVTANKEALSKHFDELQSAAGSSQSALMFEASVGGGIPLLVSYRQILASNDISSIRGIVNGTTNYILTQMSDSGAAFDDALANAQELGYAEPDPTADVEGFDAVYKLSILASMMAGEHIHPDSIEREGITGITPEDITSAAERGNVIKLLGQAKIEGGAVTASVGPSEVSSANLLAHVKDNYNAVELVGDRVGPVVLSGQGAGPDPTASAIVSDLVEAIRVGSQANIPWA
jgi:homoserine dehydrogenase